MANPRRWEISYVASRLNAAIGGRVRQARLVKARRELLVPAIESEYVNLLYDPCFQQSVAEVRDYSCLDVARLANLWTLAKIVGPGLFLEVGSFRGGTALHICNAIEDKGVPFYCFDPFEKGGFEKLGDDDTAFKPLDFTETQYEAVARLLSSKPSARVVQGYFPSAAEGMNLRDIAFCHLDVDVYEATRDSLEYLAPRLASRSLIVVDDVGHRETPGVERAVLEFIAVHPMFIMLPMFPCQAVLVPKTFWQC
jgi:O-methyltransferase